MKNVIKHDNNCIKVMRYPPKLPRTYPRNPLQKPVKPPAGLSFQSFSYRKKIYSKKGCAPSMARNEN
ncbi:hypothetical protein CW304_13435 [Bacillus sp. UFRGS-B20]|nr:hypothetical protein CW304_13435 [Bacillus sp. UFRGS-B20]